MFVHTKKTNNNKKSKSCFVIIIFLCLLAGIGVYSYKRLTTFPTVQELADINLSMLRNFYNNTSTGATIKTTFDAEVNLPDISSEYEGTTDSFKLKTVNTNHAYKDVHHLLITQTANMFGENKYIDYEIWEDDNFEYTLIAKENDSWGRVDKSDIPKEQNMRYLKMKYIYDLLNHEDIPKLIKNIDKKIESGDYQYKKTENEYILIMPIKLSDLKDNYIAQEFLLSSDNAKGTLVITCKFDLKTKYITALNISFDKTSFETLDPVLRTLLQVPDDSEMTITNCYANVKFNWTEKKLSIPSDNFSNIEKLNIAEDLTSSEEEHIHTEECNH